jgi:predicted nucleic acid-binding protein
VELADTSAWTNRGKSERISQDFGIRLEHGEIAICDPVKVELLWWERDAAAVAARREQLDALRTVSAGERAWRRALDVLELLAEQGPLHHRGPKLADLVIAAAAERAELPVLHYNRHFEVIASVTGQEVRALAPLGSLP